MNEVMQPTNIKPPVIMTGGDEIFSFIIDAIRGAKKSVFIRMFIWRGDGIGNQVGQAVFDSADRGVKVVIEKDRLGALYEFAEECGRSFFCTSLKPFELLEAKIINRYFDMPNVVLSPQPENACAAAILKHPNITVKCGEILADHSKYYVVDDEIFITGGVNIEEKERSCDLYGRCYDDFAAAVYGSDQVSRCLECLKNGAFDSGDISGISFISNPGDRKHRRFFALGQTLDFIRSAKTSLTLYMAYFGDSKLTDALIESSLHGVKLTIVLPEIANIQHDLNMRTMEKIIKCGKNVDVYFDPHMLHGKLMYADGKKVAFGSFNFNRQSTKKLGETDIVFDLEKFPHLKTELDAILDTIKSDCKKYDGEKLQYKKLRAFVEGCI